MAPRFFARPLSVVHVGQSAVVLALPDQVDRMADQLIITRGAAGLMPGGICLGSLDFDLVRDAILGGDDMGCAVDISGWADRTMAIDRVNLRLHASAISPEMLSTVESALSAAGVSAAGSGRTPDSLSSPDAIRRRASQFAQDAFAGTVQVGSLHALIGAGPGTTPSGDDVIVGTLAGLRTLGLRAEWTILGCQIEPLVSRTTSTSRHYLLAAIDGRFGEHVHDLVRALSTGQPAEHILRQASTWGATSGTDLLTGLVATLIASLPHRTIERAA